MDLRTADDDTIRDVSKACDPGYTCLRFPLKNMGVHRLCRAVRPQGRLIETVADISYPPARLTKQGRANDPGVPVFYAATQAVTALQEMRPVIGERIVLSEWKLSGDQSPHVREVGLLEIVDRVEPDLAKELRKVLEPGKKIGLSSSDLRKQRMIRKFLADEFTKIVSVGDEHEYRLSARIAHNLMSGDSDGIVYASIATPWSGVNVALRTQSLDRLFTACACMEVEIVQQFDDDRGFETRKVRGATEISPDGRILWDA